MKPIIKIENLSKQYRLGVVGTGTLSNDLKRWWHKARGKEDPFLKIGETNDRSTKGDSNYVWALKDINLEVMPGEVLGIIGKNGAGKSTLLKILSKVTGPTTGSIHFNGRIGSLLEVGTGFHPELTGRENIFLNGAILGMTKTEIKGKLDEIVDFSGVERYIDTPVKRYSSGMMVRLGFAVAAHLEPEILVVDEVLAVGDAEFQKKAIGKMQDVSSNDGRTVLFVSHNMSTIESLCNNGVLLQDGKIKHHGKVNDTISYYTDNVDSIKRIQFNNSMFDESKELDLVSANIKNTNGIITDTFLNSEDLIIEFKFKIKEKHRYMKIGFDLIFNGSNQLLTSFHNDDGPLNLIPGEQIIQFKIPGNILNAGHYSINAIAGIHRVKWIYQHPNVLNFNIRFKINNNDMPVDSRPNNLIAPILECKKIK